MQMSKLLIARGLINVNDVAKALERQQTEGGRLDDSLVALNLITQEQLDEVNVFKPASPMSIEESGISQSNLMPLLLKFMYVEQRDTPAELMDGLKLTYNIVKALLDDAVEMKWLEMLGSGTSGGTGGVGGVAKMRYALTSRGRDIAAEAQNQNHYVGPAPVSLESYQKQIAKQSIAGEQVGEERIRECFSDLVVPDKLTRQIGPAINAGRAMLLYGAAGNGKTSAAVRIARIFSDLIFVPYCIEVDGQIIVIHDASTHVSADTVDLDAALPEQSKGLRRDEIDQRWTTCRRPMVLAGGELTLDMLDLSYNEASRFYEAPIQLKALNGTLIIDDFGRQAEAPERFLNRWIVPMESRIDTFKLKTGRAFTVPFDELLIFATNLEPSELIDPAFLRRIPYKIELFGPTFDEYREIFKQVAEDAGMEIPEDILIFVIDQLELQDSLHLGFYQPKFITDHVVAACKFLDVPPRFSRELITEALNNLYLNFSLKLGAAAAQPGP